MPLGFHVQVNDDAPIRAGGESISVLSAIISHIAARNELELSLGGLVAFESAPREHVTWLERKLTPGDRIVVTIVDAGDFDPPSRRTQEDPGLKERQERRYYEHLKARFEQP